MTDFESDKNTVLRYIKTSKVTSYEILNDIGTNQVNKTKVGKFYVSTSLVQSSNDKGYDYWNISKN